MGNDGSRSLVLASVRTALSESDSLLLRSYAVVGTLVAVFTAVLFVLAFPGWVIATQGGVLDRVGRAFGGLVGLVLVASLLAPAVFFARRRSRNRPTRDALFGATGYLFLGSLYLGLIASTPAELQDIPEGVLGPVVEGLYALPRLAGLLFPALGLCLILVVEYGLDRGSVLSSGAD